MDGNIEYKLGVIDGKLDQNDKMHILILESLKDTRDSLSTLCNTMLIDIKGLNIQSTTNKIIVERIIEESKSRAKFWGVVTGLFFGLITTVANWIWYHVTR